MPSAKKIIGTIFRDAEGCILIEFLEPGELIMSGHYSSFVLHCMINVPEERSSCSMITLGFTLLV
jgi:hypothetical protein